jgi:hypothetical protein
VYFLDRIRREYLLDTGTLDDTFAKKLHLKSGKDTAVIDTILRLVRKAGHHDNTITEQDLVALNDAIEKFFS